MIEKIEKIEKNYLSPLVIEWFRSVTKGVDLILYSVLYFTCSKMMRIG